MFYHGTKLNTSHLFIVKVSKIDKFSWFYDYLPQFLCDDV